MAKSPDAFRTISEVSEWLDTKAHVLRFWESKFKEISPVKRAGGRRYYRPDDMRLIGGIKRLLHDDGMTIKGVQKLLKAEGIEHVSALSQPLDFEQTQETPPQPKEFPAIVDQLDTPPTVDDVRRDTIIEAAEPELPTMEDPDVPPAPSDEVSETSSNSISLDDDADALIKDQATAPVAEEQETAPVIERETASTVEQVFVPLKTKEPDLEPAEVLSAEVEQTAEDESVQPTVIKPVFNPIVPKRPATPVSHIYSLSLAQRKTRVAQNRVAVAKLVQWAEKRVAS